MAGKVLIVDSVATNRIVLKVKLASAHYETVQAADGAAAIALAQAARPDLVLMECRLPDMCGAEVCRALKAHPQTSAIPVLMIAADCTPAERLTMLRAGADDLFQKPFDERVLLARIRSILRMRETVEQLGLKDSSYRELGLAEPATAFTGPALIGIVGGKVETALGWKRALQAHLNDRLVVIDADAVLDEGAAQAVPDLFLVAADLPVSGGGLGMICELRSRPVTRFSSVCLATDRPAEGVAANALDLGAADLIDMNAAPAEAALRIEAQVRRKRQADVLRNSVAASLRMAMVDPLTGLHNRRYGLPALARIAEGACETGRGFAVLLIDIDRFKEVNDTWGHPAGDLVLSEIARRLKNELRYSDLLARIGGEEFLVCLPETGFDEACTIAERLRAVTSARPVCLNEGQDIRVTLSIGLALGGSAGWEADDLLARADRALLSAKAGGRNQVRLDRSAA